MTGTLESLSYEGDKGQSIQPYIRDYYNLHVYHNNKLQTAGTDMAVARVINNLLGAIMERKRLPKYLIVILDKDLIQQDVDVFEDDAAEVVQELVRWITRKIDVIFRRRKLDILDKKPGALTGFTPKVIHVRIVV